MEWNKETLNRAMEVLTSCESVTAACEALSMHYGENITRAALRSAFRRHLDNPPSSFLKGPERAPEKPQMDVLKYGQYELKMDDLHGNPVYLFRHKNDEDFVVLSSPFIEKICIQYANKSQGGLGMSTTDIIKSGIFASDFPFPDILCNNTALLALFNLIEMRKSYIPVPPHIKLNNQEDALEILGNIEVKKQALLQQSLDENRYKFQDKKIKALEKKIRTMKNLLDLPERGLPEPTIIHSDSQYQEKNGNTLFIGVADAHAGKKTNTAISRIDYENTFNKDVFQERFGKVVDIIRKTELDVYTNHIHIGFLGDIFESILGNMRPGHYLQMDAVGCEQYDLVMDAYMSVIRAALELAEDHGGIDVTALTIGGNHDRLLRAKEPETEYLLNHIIARELRSEFRNENIKIFNGYENTPFITSEGVGIIHRHGHKRSIRNQKDLNNFLTIHGPQDCHRYLVVEGHIHRFGVLSGRANRKPWRHVVLPALCGDDTFNTDHLHLSSTPEFLMMKLHSNRDEFLGPYSLL